MTLDDAKPGLRVRLVVSAHRGPSLGAVGTIVGSSTKTAPHHLAAVSWEGWQNGWEQIAGSKDYSCWAVPVHFLEVVE